MLKEAIDKIVSLTTEGVKPSVFRPDPEPGHVYYLATADGRVERREAEPSPRKHVVHDLVSLAALAGDFAPDPESGELSQLACWYSRGGFTLLLDDQTRRDRVTLPLTPSPQMTILEGWARQVTWLEQAKLVQTLRIYFGRYLDSQTPVETFRRLKFRQTQAGEKAVEHGRSSIGRSLEAELTGAGSLPAELTLYLPAFAGPLAEVFTTVRLLVEIDAQAERIALVPDGGSLDGNWARVEEELAKRLREALEGIECGVYRGVP